MKGEEGRAGVYETSIKEQNTEDNNDYSLKYCQIINKNSLKS